MNNKPSTSAYVLLALAMIGLGVTAFLAYFQYNNLIPSCAIGGCEIVLTSAHSKFFGIPWSYIGLVYYMYMFCLSVLLILDPRSWGLRFGMMVYTTVGIVYSSWAIFYIQLSVIHALCQYCLMSAITTLCLFITAIWHWRTTR